MRKTRKKGSLRWERIFAQGDNFHSALRSAVANNHPKEIKEAEKIGWDQFDTCICIHAYPFLLLWSRALPALPSGRNALSARPCLGQWLSTDYTALKSSVGDIMWLRIACNLTCRFIQPRDAKPCRTNSETSN